MATARAVQGKGVRGFILVDGTGLMAPNADISRWKKRMQYRIVTNAAMLAPSHNYALRPLRPHPGGRLKDSFIASQEYRRTTGRGFYMYSGVGSTSPYSTYVDQGTQPYLAKILPPWNRNSPTLYEHTWQEHPGDTPIGPVPVSGQKAQYFMQRALEKAMLSGGMRSVGVPDSSISNMLPTGARDFEMFGGSGATVADFAFTTRLREWRSWRKEGWTNESNKKYAQTRLSKYRDWARSERLRRDKQEARNRAREQVRRDEREAAIRASAEEAERRKGTRKQIEDKRLSEGNRDSREQSLKYFNTIKKAYPNASRGSTTLADGTVLWQVQWTDASGTTHRQRWAYGYST